MLVTPAFSASPSFFRLADLVVKFSTRIKPFDLYHMPHPLGAYSCPIITGTIYTCFCIIIIAHLLSQFYNRSGRMGHGISQT